MSVFSSYLKQVGLLTVFLLLVYLINPFNKDYLFGYALAAIIFSNQKFLKKNIDFDLVLLALFTITYAIFYSLILDLGTQFIFIYAIIPLAFYLLGKFLVAKANSTKDIFLISLMAGIFFSFSALISVLLDIGQNGFVSIVREVPMIWGGEPPAATQMGSYFLFNMCIPAILISRFKEGNLLFKLALFVVFLLSIYCVLRIGSRTQLALIIFTVIATLLYLVFKQSAKRNITIFIVAFIGINLGLRYANFNSKSDLLTSFATRMDNKKYGAGTAGGRSERWEKSLTNIIEEPLGWSLDEFSYSHNMWLDVARVGGVIAFILLVLYTIRSFGNLRRAISRNPNELALNNLIICFSIAMFLQFFVEPIFEGIFHLFIFYCFFQGIINGYLKKFSENMAKLD